MRVAIVSVLVVILTPLVFVQGPFVSHVAQAAPTELFFSEYIEGTGNNKALEIFNGTGASINLTAGAYNVQMFFNGSPSPGLTINLTGTIATGDVFVLAQSTASLDILAQADQTNSAGWFNGDDAVVLRKGTTVIDVIGQIGFDPGNAWASGLTSTLDNTLRRKPSVETGDANPSDPFDPAAEWDGFGTNAFGGLGSHLAVVPPPPLRSIGQVQGEVLDGADGRAHRSPFAPASGNSDGRAVRIQGVLYQKTLARSGAGQNQFGFFIQNTATTADDNPNTSDGVFVFIGSFPTVLNAILGGPLYTPRVGDEIILQGLVTEFFNLTEITTPLWVSTVRTGVNIDAEVPPFEVNPPDGLADAYRYWERREGMRARIPTGSLVVGRELWVVRPDNALAARTDPYARRVFRDPHPLDDIPGTLFDNGNGFRIILGSLGIKAAAGNNTTLIAPVRTFDTFTNAAVGGVYFSFNKYQIMVDQQVTTSPGPDPSANAPVPVYDRNVEYRVATFNVENLYDFRDDPTDGCDFAGNTGCPGVNPPFDYVPASNAVYQQKLEDLADQIITDLHSPDVILVQEIEDQDICHVTSTGLACGGATSGDGKPDPLQELALKVTTRGGPTYDSAYDRDGADDRGIINAFFYRTDRVELLSPSAGDPVLGSSPQVEYRGTALGYNAEVQNPKALNADLPSDVDLSTGVDGSNVFTRPPQVGLFRVWRTDVGASVFTDLYLLSNHFSSGPNIRVGQRTEQAAYNAAIVAALQRSVPQVRVVVGGDFNVYPRPDDPFAPGDTLFPSDQLRALYNVGLRNLWDTLLAQRPSAAYSYVFEGQTQTLDQIFVSPTAATALQRMWAAHVNSDWPADFSGDGARGISDHDPQGYDVRLLTVERLEALVRYYQANGAIQNAETALILINHLTNAARFLGEGKRTAYDSQLRAFANQAQGLAPGRMTQASANALAAEASLLGSVGP